MKKEEQGFFTAKTLRNAKNSKDFIHNSFFATLRVFAVKNPPVFVFLS
jgi:hypothetical protein